MTTVDLEIRLFKGSDEENYGVQLTAVLSDYEESTNQITGEAAFDLPALEALELDCKKYGQLLFNNLFGSQPLLKFFENIYTVAQVLGATLRLRLSIAPEADNLHRLRWELLCRPNDFYLLTKEFVFFSRYIDSQDFRFERLRPQNTLRALIVVANPENLDIYSPNEKTLAPIDVNREIERAKTALTSIPSDDLGDQKVTLNHIIESLRNGYDILYLVCHGAFINQQSVLYLEDEDKKVIPVSGEDFIKRLDGLQKRPRLIILAACESSGAGNSKNSFNNSLTSLGPQLAQTGIPAVLAMQGIVSMETIDRFMPAFFKEFCQSGELDKAVTIARGTVTDRDDHWMPVFFTRLRTSRIGWFGWYRPGFPTNSTNNDIRNWEDIISSIRTGYCTPILGAGLTEFLFGSRREIAQLWAQKYNFPLASYLRNDLTQVAQFLAVDQSMQYPRRHLIEFLGEELQRRYGSEIQFESRELDEMISVVWYDQLKRNKMDSFKALAELPLPLFINTNPDRLLEYALGDTGKQPQTGVLEWRNDRNPEHLISKPDRPSIDKPMVYHLFGLLSDINSLVLTEDDFFEYLFGLGMNKELIPSFVRSGLTDRSLLFLGFQLDEWNFRCLLRSIIRLAKGGRLNEYSHVAVQVDPAETNYQDVERASRYLQRYFERAQISIYRGSVEDFTSQLKERLNS